MVRSRALLVLPVYACVYVMTYAHAYDAASVCVHSLSTDGTGRSIGEGGSSGGLIELSDMPLVHLLSLASIFVGT